MPDKKKWAKSPHRRFEKDHLKKINNHFLIAGCDEVGRGALAGPVVIAIVVWLPEIFLMKQKPSWAKEIRDSKLLSSKQRANLYPIIKKKAYGYALGVVSAEIIDKINILQATKLAISWAMEKLQLQGISPSILLLDNLKVPQLPTTIIQKSIVAGDRRCFSIASASIVAKVFRDRMMEEWHKKKIFEPYGFHKNKGYGVAHHKKVLYEIGRSSLHRKSFTKFLSS